jgi:hypothetical protein
MFPLDDAVVRVGRLPPAAATAPLPAMRRPRVRPVEPVAEGTSNGVDRRTTDQQDAPIVALIKRSVEQFKRVLEQSRSVSAAAAISGFSVGGATPAEAKVDEYA